MPDSGSKGRYLVSSTLKCQEWAYSLFELISENKVGDGCKDVHSTELSRLYNKPAIKKFKWWRLYGVPKFFR